MNNKLSKINVYQWLILAITIVAIVLINIISYYTAFKIDMTEDQRYSLAEGTKKYLSETIKKQNAETRIDVYLDGKIPSELRIFKNSIEEKLKEFQNLTDGNIKFGFINPNEGSEDDQRILEEKLIKNGIKPLYLKYKVNSNNPELNIYPAAKITYSEGGQNFTEYIQLIQGNWVARNRIDIKKLVQSKIIETAINGLEYNLINGLRKVHKLHRKRIALLQGHGELNSLELKSARDLISPYYIVDTAFQINGELSSLKKLKEYDGLIIANPLDKFTFPDLAIIDQFLLNGGSLMCFMNTLNINPDTLYLTGRSPTARQNIGLQNMLFDYGIKVNNNLVLDANSIPKYAPAADDNKLNTYSQIISTKTNHPIVRNIDPVVFEFSNQIEFTNNKGIPILTTSSNSARTGLVPIVDFRPIKGLDVNNPKFNENPKDPNNRLCVAGLIEGTFSSYFMNQEIQQYINKDSLFNSDLNILKKSSNKGKLFVVGNGRFISNRYGTGIQRDRYGKLVSAPNRDLQTNLDANYLQMNMKIGNAEFFQNVVDYMMGNKYMLEIRSKQIDVREIDKEKVSKHANYYKLINLVIPISIILITGIIIGVIRRIRFTK